MTLELFHKLVDLNCEDLMLELVLRSASKLNVIILNLLRSLSFSEIVLCIKLGPVKVS